MIVAVYNSAKGLQRCLDSFAAQDDPHKELIEVDGGSGGGSVQILKRNQRLISYWESNPDRDVYQAWKKALDHVHGDWIHFLGTDDDYSAQGVFTRAGKWLKSCDPYVRVGYGIVTVVTQSGSIWKQGESHGVGPAHG